MDSGLWKPNSHNYPWIDNRRHRQSAIVRPWNPAVALISHIYAHIVNDPCHTRVVTGWWCCHVQVVHSTTWTIAARPIAWWSLSDWDERLHLGITGYGKAIAKAAEIECVRNRDSVSSAVWPLHFVIGWLAYVPSVKKSCLLQWICWVLTAWCQCQKYHQKGSWKVTVIVILM